MFWAVRRGAGLSPLFLFVLVLMPWLPVPPALQVWTGGLVILVWIAVACACAAPFVRGMSPPRRPVLTAGVLAFAIGLVAWWQVSPQVPGGDEPHYLVITQSLLSDGDLQIENNHRQRDYRSYFAGELRPDFRVRGRNQEIYSIHAPGVAALVAPAFLVAGYPGAVVLLLVIAALGSALTWHLAWMATGRHDAAWFAWAAVTASATWIFHSFTIYPDGPGAVLLLTGAWALLRLDREALDRSEAIKPWFWHGVALALLPWMHTRFSVLAGGVGALVLLRLAHVPNAGAKAFAFLVVPGVSCLAWLGHFIAIYGTPDPSAPYGGEEGAIGFVPGGLAGLLFDQRFGFVAYAPALIFAFVGIGIMLARRDWRRHALQLLFVLIPYVFIVTYVAMWWGGRSAPARFFMPVLPWMAVPIAIAWSVMTRRSTRVTALAALGFTVFASGVLVFAADGQFAFNSREAPAQWLDWLNSSLDLANGLPAWSRDADGPLFLGAAIWLAAGLGAWLSLLGLERSGILVRRPAFIVATGLTFAAAASVALSLSWRAEGVPGQVSTPSQLGTLRTVSSERRLLPLRLPSFERLSADKVASLLHLQPERATVSGGAGRNDVPLFLMPAVPAGEYYLRPVAGRLDGWLMIGIGRDQFAVETVPLTESADGLTVRFPVDVRALIVRGDEEARRNVHGLEIKPLSVVLPEDRITDGYARHAVRYASATTFFMDDESYPEPSAFWVRGASTSEVVIQPAARRAAQPLLIRNGARENTVLIATGSWREELRLGPGEERHIDVPMDPTRDATSIRFTTSDGFTPSQVDPKSRDSRFLGVWVKVGG